MPTYEVNDDISPFNRVVFISNRWGSVWYNGSGVIVGSNDVLTAAHVGYNEELGGWSDECRIYPSWDPDNSSHSTNYYVSAWRRGYTDWDEDGDGLLTRGDNKAESLYELERDICLISLNEDIGSIYGWMGLKFDFNGGNASKLGYPGKHDNNLMYDEGYVYKDSIDNYFWFYLSDIELNPGDSGGPIYVNSGGELGYQVVGVNSSTGNSQGSAVALNAFANGWITEEIISNNYLYDKSFASITSEDSVDEGSSISFTFKTHKSEEDKQYTYRLSGISSLDIASNELSGQTTINSDGEATFTIGISADKLTEGTETLTLSIGEKTKSITINDTSKTSSPEIEADAEKPIIYGVNGVTTASSVLWMNENETYINTFTANEEVIWSLPSYWDENILYNIDSVSGVLSFKQAPDFENPSPYSNQHTSSQISFYPVVRATDLAGNYQQQSIMLLVKDIEVEAPNASIAATSTELQQLYIGYFGRPCDPAGLDYWLGQGVTKKAFAANMYLQPEFNSVNGNLSTVAQVNQIYLNLFNREGDASGLTYWTNQIKSGNLELASIANDLIYAVNNSTGGTEEEILQRAQDLDCLSNRTAAANAYTVQKKESLADILAYSPESIDPWIPGGLEEGKSYMRDIGCDNFNSYIPYPIIDTSYVIIKRIINKKSPFIADKSHIHHLIIKKGYSQLQCLFIISGLTGVFQLLTLLYLTY